MTTVTDVSVPGLNGVRSWEGRALRAYQDSVNVWTLGYGLTNYDKGLPFKIGPGVTITAEQAEWLLYKHLRADYLPDVERALNFDRCPNPQGACDGGLSMHFNTGGILRASWPRELMSANLGAAKASLESWNKAGGKVLSGLVKRRAWEWGVISRGDYGNLGGPGILGLHGRIVGQAEVLTELPTDPDLKTAGNVHKDGVPVQTIEAPSVIKDGSQGEPVTDVQRNLTAAGYTTPETGVYDDATKKNVTDFQKAHPQITADGQVGPATTNALIRAVALRTKVGQAAKAAPAVPAGYIAVHQWVNAHLGDILLTVGIVALAAVVAYIAWSHRYEIQAFVNKALGRTVV